jgi:rRNA maturation protein Nop10
MGVMFALCLGLAISYVRPLFEKSPRYWDEWVLRFAAPLLPITLPIVFFWMYRSHRRIYRLANNLCPECGYDLRESLERCPECGVRS